MLRDFFKQLHDIHPFIGNLFEWSVIGLLLTVALFLLSIPGHILSEATKGPISDAAAFIKQIILKVREATKAIFAAALKRSNEFASLAQFRMIFDQNEGRLLREFHQIADAARDVSTQVNDRTSAIDAGIRRLNDQIDALAKTEFTASNPDIPDLKKLQLDDSTHRRAIWKFTAGLLLAPILIAINTVMLHEFFRGVISLYVFGIQLSLVLALFFSILELSIGVWLYSQQQKSATTDVRHVFAEILLITAVAALAAVEMFFYAILSSQIDPTILRPLFPAGTVPYWALYWLSPIGFVIVIVLAFTGHALVEAWDDLRHGATVHSLRSQLTAIQSAGSKLIQEFEIAKGHAKQLISHTKEFKKYFVGGKDQLPEISTLLENECEKLRTAAEEASAIRREPYADVDPAEGVRQFYIQIALGVIAVLVIWIFTFIQITFIPHLGGFVSGASSVPLIIALVEAGTILGASYLLGHKVRVAVKDKDAKIIITPQDVVFTGAAATTILAVAAFNIFLIVRKFDFNELLWVALALTCIGFMTYIGRNLGLLVAALWIASKGISLSIVSACGEGIAIVLGFIRITLLTISGVLLILGYPYSILSNLLGRKPKAIEPT